MNKNRFAALVAAVTTTLSLSLVHHVHAAPMIPDGPGVSLAVNQPDSYRSSFRSYDLTGDDWPDLLARNSASGDLALHRHSGSVNGASTFESGTLVGVGWNMHNWIGVGNFVDSDAKDGSTGDDEAGSSRYLGDIVARRASDGVLMIYPHSGTVNGTSTWLAPVNIGTGWNGIKRIWVADVTQDGYDDIVAMDGQYTVWVYPNLRTLRENNTLGSRIKISANVAGPAGDGRTFYSFTHWYGNAPDFATVETGGGPAYYSPMARPDLTENTWSWTGYRARVLAYGGMYGGIATVADVTGNGNDDILMRQFSGELHLYPVRSSRLDRTDGLDAVVNLGGNWNAYDVIT
ncbi:hypothetical protein [Saccharothrix hoggarensis]|uniref:VCBS repeat protein n=1 Tax=Saccharothrix hoggarensis TaxID=913853 RepID=A0ABW3QLA9_9PSEU